MFESYYLFDFKLFQELKRKCKLFATALLDHTRTSHELEIILNYDPLQPVLENDGRMTLRRLRLAVKLHQKEVNTILFIHIQKIRFSSIILGVRFDPKSGF